MEMGQLEQLIEMGVCDEQTAEVLADSDSNVVQDMLSYAIHQVKQYEDSDDKKFSLGKKLLFLEELADESEDVQSQVHGWLSEKKRNFLFKNSDQADLYGELLVAKAKGELGAFREEYNGDVPAPKPYVAERKLVIERSEEDAPLGMVSLAEQKYQAVMRKMFDEMVPIDRFDIAGRDSSISEELEPVSPSTLNFMDAVYDHFDELNSNMNDKDLNFLSSTFPKFSSGESHWTAADNKEIARGNARKYRKELNLDSEDPQDKIKFLNILKKKIQAEVEQYRTTTFAAFVDEMRPRVHDFGYKHWLNDIGFEPTPSDIAELNSLNGQLANTKLSNKLKNAENVTYSIRLSENDPTDVKFGNDSGCCIGVYENSDNIGNAYGLPQMMADNATYVLEVMQKINGKKEKRVGIVLAYHTEDKDDNKVFACNSLELSPSMVPSEHLEQVVEYVEEEIETFAKRNKFRAANMSRHEYNTSRNYSAKKGSEFDADPEILTKVQPNKVLPMYSEILDDGFVDVGQVTKEFYVIFDDRSKE